MEAGRREKKRATTKQRTARLAPKLRDQRARQPDIASWEEPGEGCATRPLQILSRRIDAAQETRCPLLKPLRISRYMLLLTARIITSG